MCIHTHLYIYIDIYIYIYEILALIWFNSLVNKLRQYSVTFYLRYVSVPISFLENAKFGKLKMWIYFFEMCSVFHSESISWRLLNQLNICSSWCQGSVFCVSYFSSWFISQQNCRNFSEIVNFPLSRFLFLGLE